jgi:hypothetical protein
MFDEPWVRIVGLVILGIVIFCFGVPWLSLRAHREPGHLVMHRGGKTRKRFIFASDFEYLRHPTWNDVSTDEWVTGDLLRAWAVVRDALPDDWTVMGPWRGSKGASSSMVANVLALAMSATQSQPEDDARPWFVAASGPDRFGVKAYVESTAATKEEALRDLAKRIPDAVAGREPAEDEQHPAGPSGP